MQQRAKEEQMERESVKLPLLRNSQPQLPRRLCPSLYLESRLLHHLVHTELMHILSILSPYPYPYYMPSPYGMTPYPYPPVPAPIPSDSKQKPSSKSSTSAAVSSTSNCTSINGKEEKTAESRSPIS